MLIKITKNQAADAQEYIPNEGSVTLFPAGEYLANLTPDGKIEILVTRQLKALFSFSQFREKVSQGDFVVLEN
ncbi:hypothetical protein [Polynucleobacter sp. AP-Melu-500A-A1]|uniref:hypothetical protein n=1 Tax=Polynucleobacter sp. AP-Melu-500A-A1 TaxID=2576929 RepID=UPI001C0D5CFA|nr:hypothetical protein [Polynucleobacter sp. AP-Melu-500A-A1]MBU3631404.1 hypothetical protein [Polynucleobacter sp. AP-Melu-500A-A1]